MRTSPALATLVCLAVLGSACRTQQGQAQAAKFPPSLVGTWASDDAEFSQGMPTAGTLVFISADGAISLFVTPPPLAIPGKIDYDSATNVVRATFVDEGSPQQPVGLFDYDAKAKRLTLRQSADFEATAFTHKDSIIPRWALSEASTAE